ncbi:unnamed protein product [Sphagnum troendelagicum]|uniref:Uncharacterized protein n=1 Tax=Sphagnum troendelagicum TaxID=128251 RepID=A0ABP0U1A0_9BRYO
MIRFSDPSPQSTYPSKIMTRMIAIADVSWVENVQQNLNAKSAEVSGIRRERDTNKGGRGQTASEHTLSRLGDHQITKDKSSWRQWRRYEGTLPKNINTFVPK